MATILFYESDFTLLETIKDIAGNEIDPRTINFVISYYTDWQNKYQASHKNGKYVNCDYDAGSGKLIVIFAKHGLRPGILKHKLMVMSDDSLFPLSIRNDKSLADTDITLALTGGDAYTAESTLVVPAMQITHSATQKDNIKDADEFNYLDSGNGFGIVKTTWLNIKAKLKAYFDTIYASITHNHNLNDLTEKSYNSLTDTPSLDFEPANANIQSHIGDGDIHVTSEEKSTWSGKQDALTFANDIETDKASTTKISAIKTFYDWAVGRFIDLAKIVTTWTATTLNTNVPSEKLVKDSLDLKADITPANGSTSALRALYIARSWNRATLGGAERYELTYNATSGYYEMYGITNLTEADILNAYIASQQLLTVSWIGAFAHRKARVNFPIGYFIAAGNVFPMNYIAQNNIDLEKFIIDGYYNEVTSNNCVSAFNGCSSLNEFRILRCASLTSAALVNNMFFGCTSLVTCYLKQVKVDFSFSSSPLLSLASLQYLVTNRANGMVRITITVHQTVWDKLNDAGSYPEWNDLLLDAYNQYIDFAKA